MEFRQPNALSNSIENVLRRNFPRRQSPDNVADVETQTSFENLSNTGALVQRCPLCMQLQPNMNTVNRHSMGEAIQYSNGSQDRRAVNNDLDNLGGNTREDIQAPIQCTDHDEPPMTRRTFAGRGMTDAVTGSQYKIVRMHLELVPYEEQN